MSPVVWELLILLLLVGINGIMAMSELAVVSARRVRLQQRADAGDAGARAALALAAEPNRFLSTVQIGITLVGILAGAFGGATLARIVAAWLAELPGLAAYAEPLAVGLVVVAISYLSLVLGELVPKRIAMRHAEAIAARVARPMNLLARVAAPVVAVLSVSTETVLRAFSIRASEDTSVTTEEIRLLVEQGRQAGVLNATEQEIVTSVFRLGDRRVDELMTPRPQVVWLDLDAPASDNWGKIAASPHARFPVCRGALDEVVGVVHVKDLWAPLAAGRPGDLPAAVRPALFVPGSLPALKAVETFKQAGTHLAVVLDEYGGTEGVVTLTDVLEALVGDLPDRGEPDEPRVVQRDDGSWLLDALLPVDELKDLLALDRLPEENEYQTLSGFLLLQMGRVPETGDYLEWNGLRFEVVDMDGRRIDKVLVHRAPA